MKFNLLIFCLFFYAVVPVMAQLPFMAEQLTEAEGMLSNYVEDVAWDKQNRLWMATDKGVSVFNGSKMRHFTSADGLAQSYITELACWPLVNRMIMLSPAGSLYASDGNSLQQLTLPENEKVVMFKVLTDGDLVIAGRNNKQFIQWYVAKGLQFSKDLFPIYKEREKLLLLNIIMRFDTIEVADKNVFFKESFDIKLPVIEKIFPKELLLKDVDQFSDCKVVLKNDSIYWTEKKMTKSFAKGSIDFKTILNPVTINYKGKPALLFFTYNTGNLLLITQGGERLVIPASHTGLAAITSMKMGPGGMVFICTMGQGIYYFKPGSFDIMFEGKKIARIAEDGEKYWVSADDEIVEISAGKSPIFSGIKANAVTSLTATKDFLHVTGISSYYKIPKTPAGLARPSFTFTNTAGLSGFRMLGNGSFELSTYTFGLFHFASTQSKPSTSYLLDNIIERTIHLDSGVAFTSYSAGTLLRYHNGKEQLLNSQSGLLSNMVYDVSMHGDSIWVSTELGLNLVCSNSVYQYAKKEGFAGKRCLYTFQDKEGRRFVVSDVCLMLLEQGKLRPLLSYKIKKKGSSICSVLFSPDKQQLLLATTDGLIMASVEGIAVDSVLVYPIIYDATTSEGNLLSPNKKQVLPASAHNLNIQVGFNYPDFSGGPTLFYLLEGWNDSWQPVPSDYQLTFPVLSSGSYKLKMKATNADGFSSKAYTMLEFTILPPWYLKWYMIAFYIVALAATVFSIARWWARRRLAQQMEAFKMHQQLEIERNRISSELHDNVGSQLTNIIAQLDFLENAVQLQPKQVLLQKVEGLQQKARYAMGQLRESIWVLKEDAIRLEDFMLKIHRLFEEVFVSETGVRYQINHLEQKPIQLSPWQAVNLLRVIQEGLQNIQKHAMAKAVTLTFSIIDEKLKIILQDDGRGFIPFDPGTHGHGLQNMQHRMQQLNGTLKINSEINAGTSLQLTIPISSV